MARQRIGVRLLQMTAASLLALSCAESPTGVTVSAPGGRLTIESPIADQVVGDGVVLFKGSAVADGYVESIRLSRHYVYPDGRAGSDSSWYMYETQFVYGPNGQTASGYRDFKKNVQFSSSLRGEAGLLVIKFEMVYRLVIGGEAHFLTDTIPLRIYRKPAIIAATTFPDTLYQRSLKLSATARGLATSPRTELSMDGGAPVTTGALVAESHSADSTTWSFDFPDTLANGRHTLKLRLLDEMGVADSVSRTFVTYVADAAYTVSPLPGRGGSDADALGLNASGDVAGWAKDAAGVDRAMLWQSGGSVILPMGPTARSSRAFSVNDADDVAGFISDTSGATFCDRAALWRGSGWSFVGVGSNYCGEKALAINTPGDLLLINQRARIYGKPDTLSWVIRASGTIQTFGAVSPNEMNAQGVIVGSQDYGGGVTDFGPSVKYPTFRSLISGGRITGGHKNSINATGQIVGVYNNTLYFSSNPAVEAIDLNPYLGPAQFTSVAVPIHVTDNATILAFHDAINTAFLWRNGKTTRVRLTTAGYTLDRVKSMNDRGQIIGHAIEASTGIGRAVLLNPAP